MNEQLVSDLKELKTLLENPARWTQGVNARNSNGNQVDARSTNATCFCLYGNAARVTFGTRKFVYGSTEHERYGRVTSMLQRAVPRQPGKLSLQQPIAAFNDSATHAAVMAVIDKAIELAPSYEG